jgi:hypothetical protein
MTYLHVSGLWDNYPVKRNLIIFVTLAFLSTGLASNSYADTNGEALVWSASPIRPSINLGTSYNHIDASKKLKWYVWDLEKNYFLSNRQPYSIRIAKEIKLIDKNANCTSVPINIRRELSEKDILDTSNQTYIQFFQADFGSNRSITPTQITARPIILTINPTSWKGKSQEEIISHLPICKDSIGKSIADLIGNEVTINFRIAYSTNVDETLMNIDPKCTEVLEGKCMFYSGVTRILGVKFNQSDLNLESMKYAYQETIDKEKDYLQAKPCDVPYASYDQQSNSNIMVKDNIALCESSQRNLNFLNSEISRASKLLQPTPSPSPTPTKLASATPTPAPTLVATPSPNPTKVAVAKRITITCMKGKTTKKVTGINPKCPSGFRRK